MKIDGLEDEHGRSRLGCDACWKGFPRNCACGGVIHAEFGDEDSDGDYWLLRRCTRCGADYAETDSSLIDTSSQSVVPL